MAAVEHEYVRRVSVGKAAGRRGGQRNRNIGRAREQTGADGSRWRLSSHRDDPERGKLRHASQCIISPKRNETEESISDGNAVSAAGRHQQGGI
jgi:hypothetical protein